MQSTPVSRASFGIRCGGNQIAKLSQNSELGCGWFGLSFFHLCRVTKLKSHANHFFLCFNRNSYGMAVSTNVLLRE
jgi:hypothetical protein